MQQNSSVKSTEELRSLLRTGWFLCKSLSLWKACDSFLCKYCKRAAQSWASLVQPASDGARGLWMLCVGSPKGGKWDANPCFGAAEDERDVAAKRVLLWCCTDRQMCACAAQPRPCLGIGCWRHWLWVRAAPLCLLLALGFHCCLFCHKAEMPVPCYCVSSVKYSSCLLVWDQSISSVWNFVCSFKEMVCFFQHEAVKGTKHINSSKCWEL